MESKFRQMDEVSLRILQYCAECGMNFNSNLVANLSGKSRLDVLSILNKIEEHSNLIHENIEAAASNDQGNDMLSGEFSFASIVYVDSLKSFTRCYGKNQLFAKVVQINIFDLLFSNVNMTQEFLNSFFFYQDNF